MLIKSRLIVLVAVLLLLSLIDCSNLIQSSRTSSTGLTLPRLNFSDSEVDDYNSLNEDVVSVTLNWNSEVPLTKIRAGLLGIVTILAYNLVSIASLNMGLTISIDLCISLVFIYLLQFYFGYAFRINPFRIEEMHFKPEEMVPIYWVWAVLIPISWMTLISYLCLPMHLVHIYWPYFTAVLSFQVLLVLIASFNADWLKVPNVRREEAFESSVHF